MNTLQYISTTVTALLVSSVAFGAAFDVRTTQSESSTTVVPRLFLDPAFTSMAPAASGNDAANTGSVLWFVADKNNNGLPISVSGSGSVLPGGILGSDDEIIFNTQVDGTIIGQANGRYQRIGVTVPDSFNAANIPVYAFLWNPTSGTLGQPDSIADVVSGMQFGISLVSVTLDTPDPGNGRWSIYQNVNASQFTVGSSVAVPDSGSLSAAALLALGGLAVLRRKA